MPPRGGPSASEGIGSSIGFGNPGKIQTFTALHLLQYRNTRIQCVHAFRALPVFSCANVTANFTGTNRTVNGRANAYTNLATGTGVGAVTDSVTGECAIACT